MGLQQLDLFNSPYAGIFCATNDELTLVPPGIPADDREAVAEALGTTVVEVTVGGGRLLGTLVALNAHGMVVADLISPREHERLTELAAAYGLRLAVLDDRANAAGNNLLISDTAGICHPRIAPAAQRAASETLGVELAPLQLLEFETVGMAACVTAKGGLVHAQLPDDEVAALSERFGVAFRHGTVSFGMPLVGAGVVATRHGAICGRATTGIELGRVEEALELF